MPRRPRREHPHIKIHVPNDEPDEVETIEGVALIPHPGRWRVTVRREGDRWFVRLTPEADG